MHDIESFTISKEDEGTRLDQLLKQRYTTHSRTYFHYLIEQGAVLLNNQVVKKKEKVKHNDSITLSFLQPPPLSLEPEEIPLDILYEDEELIAVNKQANMVVHPAAGHPNHTFVNALLFHCKEIKASEEETLRPGIVHRLDKDTTGVLLAAKTPSMHAALIELFATRKMQKRYLAICIGTPPHITIDAPIGRDPLHRKKMKVVETKGREAISSIKSLDHTNALSLVEILPHTGRTHQIRVHLKHLGFPILGDPLYGSPSTNKKYGIERPLLHAFSISFLHPRTLKPLFIEAPLPVEFLNMTREMRRSCN